MCKLCSNNAQIDGYCGACIVEGAYDMFCTVPDCIVCYLLKLRRHLDWNSVVKIKDQLDAQRAERDEPL